jgi:hypothetical protein
MPRVFISYARHDLIPVQQIEHALQTQDIAVWRDQESIYGGQQWPKVIGEAIAAHDYVLLVWSKSAAQSHFVAFEWNTAIALRKTILPCLLDDTPLPPALSAVNAIDVRQLDEALPRILPALKQPVPAPDHARTTDVIAHLRSLAPAEPEEVVEAARSIFAQQGWSVQGNVYQAAGDLHLTIAQPETKPTKTIVEKWQTWVALFVGVLTITSLAADLPGKICKIFVISLPRAMPCQVRAHIENAGTLGSHQVTFSYIEISGSKQTRQFPLSETGKAEIEIAARQRKNWTLTLVQPDGSIALKFSQKGCPDAKQNIPLGPQSTLVLQPG